MSIIPEGKVLHFFGRMAAAVLSLALVIATALPMISSNAWWIRVFDFPRIQIAVLIGLTLAGYAGLRRFGRLLPWEYVIAALAGIALIWQLISIAPYTAIYPTEMADSQAETDSNRISLLAYNVLSGSREVEPLRELIRETDPDIILLAEPTRWWLEQLGGLENDYPYTLLQPQENHYGMLLYSRLELVNPEIRFLIEPEIPSFRSQVRLRSGTLITLYGVHPRPPGIDQPDTEESSVETDEVEEDEGDDRQDSDMRDAELLLVAEEVGQLGGVPVIVAGDFNDVAWSYTTNLFKETGGLLDPRVGRGLFNSFDATNGLLRYPLDHVFASEHFFLVELRRLPDIGSDHFPILAVLDYNPDAAVSNEEPQPDPGDAQEVDEAIQEGQSND